MRRHTVLKLAGRLENPSERYSVGWQEWMRRANEPPPVAEDVTFDECPVNLAVGLEVLAATERAIFST